MAFPGRWVNCLFLACAVLVPLSLAAQSRQAAASVALDDQQMTGKRLFQQNCALCHLPEPENRKDPNDVGTSIGPLLEGVFRPPRSRPEAVVRTFIQQGAEEKMPGFRYGLEPAEIDAIISYLKTL